MSKTLTLTNALAAQPEASVSAVGLSAISLVLADGLGNRVELRIPRSQAQKFANAINGTANGQIREELELAERSGNITEAQMKRLTRIREAAARTAEMNAARKAAAEARKADGKGKAKLKAVA